MPKKYHIHVQNAPNRYPTIGKSGIVDWGEGCLKCAECVKHKCIYGVYRKRSFSTDILADTIDELCKNCFRCVQGCPKRLIHKTLNPEYEALGDHVYTPDIISITWDQAESGKIPVSGAGYGGPFSGPGFDSMWTDMSEIVRPTRDGIHGREYISTVVDLGQRPGRLEFSGDGKLLSKPLSYLRIPIPIVIDMFPFGNLSPAVWTAAATAAQRLGTLMVAPEAVARELKGFENELVPFIESARLDTGWAKCFRMVQIPDGSEAVNSLNALKKTAPKLLVSVRMPALSEAGRIKRIVELHRAGADAVHCVADQWGIEPGVENGLHLKDVIKEVHAGLLSEGVRDEVTFIAGGGIAMAEHVIKSMLCGANLVSVEVPLLVALECRVCRNCREGGSCPVHLSEVDSGWGAQRMINLIGAWHNQLLEMMGAMGIREARRLRGEQGRLMFKEDMETDTFAQLFAQR